MRNINSPPPFFTANIDSTSEMTSDAKRTEVTGGNSNPPSIEKRPDWDGTGRYRNWVYTYFGTETVDPGFSQHVKYHVWQVEICPDTGRPHLQGYVQLHNPKGLGGMKILGGKKNSAHWEPRWGNHVQARNYCMKIETRAEGTREQVGPWETGTPADDQGQRNDIHRVVEYISEGKTMEQIADIAPEMIIKYHRGMEKLIDLKTKNRQGENPEVTIIFGPSGSGKTHYVYERHGWDNVYSVTSHDGKWWDGYNQQEAVLFDEAEFSMANYKMLKQICDKYPFQVEIKGGFKKFKSKYIYFVNSIEKKAKQFLFGDLYRRIDTILKFRSDRTCVMEIKEILSLPVPGDIGFPDISKMNGGD